MAVEAPVQLKAVEGGVVAGGARGNPWYREPRLAHDPKHMSPFVFKENSPIASRQNPTKPPLEKETALLFFLFPCVKKKKKSPCPFLSFPLAEEKADY